MLRDRMRRKLLSSSEECLGMADMGEIGESAVYPKYNAGKTPIQSCGQETRRHRHRRPARASPAAIMFAKSLQNPYRTPTLESRHAPNRPPAPATAADGLRRRCGHLLRRPRQQRPHADDTAFAGVFLERRGDGAAAGLAPAGLPAPLRSRHHAGRRRGIELLSNGDNLWTLRAGKQLWRVDTQTCGMLADPKDDPGQLLGTFKPEGDHLIFEAVAAPTSGPAAANAAAAVAAAADAGAPAAAAPAAAPAPAPAAAQ